MQLAEPSLNDLEQLHNLAVGCSEAIDALRFGVVSGRGEPPSDLFEQTHRDWLFMSRAGRKMRDPDWGEHASLFAKVAETMNTAAAARLMIRKWAPPQRYTNAIEAISAHELVVQLADILDEVYMADFEHHMGGEEERTSDPVMTRDHLVAFMRSIPENLVSGLRSQLDIEYFEARRFMLQQHEAAASTSTIAPAVPVAAGHEAEPAATNTTTEQARAWAESYVQEHGFQGGRDLTRKCAQALGSCSPSTMLKAIEGSDYLSKKKREHGLRRIVPLGEPVNLSDSTLAKREADTDAPSDTADIDAVIRKLIEAAKPAERARLNQMSDAAKRELAVAYNQGGYQLPEDDLA